MKAISLTSRNKIDYVFAILTLAFPIQTYTKVWQQAQAVMPVYLEKEVRHHFSNSVICTHPSFYFIILDGGWPSSPLLILLFSSQLNTLRIDTLRSSVALVLPVKYVLVRN